MAEEKKNHEAESVVTWESWLKEQKEMKVNYYNDGEILESLYDAHLVSRKLKCDARFLTKEGVIEFNYYDEQPTMATIFYVEIFNKHKGIFTRFLHQLATDMTIDTICVACVSSFVLDSMLRKLIVAGKKFKSHACDFYWYR